MTSRLPRTTDESTSLSRRRLLYGTAWAVPAITLASAAPAFAASGPADQLRVNVVEAKWIDVLDEWVHLRLSVTNLGSLNAGALSLRFTFRGPWVRFDNGTVALVNVDAIAGGFKWGPNWSRPQSTQHAGTGANRHATTIFTLASLPAKTTSGELDISFNSTNPSIYGSTSPVEITPTTIPSGFTMAPTSATQIIPTT